MRKNQSKKILSISANLISKKGYHGVSLQQIADKAKLHKSTFFHYFKNKESLLVRIIESPFDEFYRNFQELIGHHELGPEEKLKIVIDNHLTLLVEYKDNVNIFLNELRNLPIKNRKTHLMKIKNYERDFEEIIVGMKKKGYFKGLDPKIVTFGILGMMNWVTRWYKRTGPITIEEISDIFYQMVTKM
jgi:AcrR family transcriptional regulator